VCGVELRRRAFEVEDSYIAAVGLALRRSFQASTHGPTLSANVPAPYEVRLRVTGRVASQKFATRVPREVEALYTNGPAGGGAAGSTREVIAIHSALIPRGAITHMVHYEES